MTFAWPWMLLSLAAVPLVVLGYRRLLRRQAVRQEQLAALGMVATGSARGRRWRHAGPALLLGALTLLLVSLARPEATIAEPRREGTVILAFDVSTSMAATDLSPTRMEATFDDSTSRDRKFRSTNRPRLPPIRSFRLGTIAVCGILMPSG